MVEKAWFFTELNHPSLPHGFYKHYIQDLVKCLRISFGNIFEISCADLRLSVYVND